MQRQIGDKEVEIDTLIKLSKEDLWKTDLDDFINEWRFQLEDEQKRQKKVANLGRRASSKLKTQIKPAGKKRRANDDEPSDSDFGGAKVKKIVKQVQPKAGLLSNLDPKPKLKQQPSIMESFAKSASISEPSGEDPKPEVKGQDDLWLDGVQDHESDVPVKPKSRGRPKAATIKASAASVPAKAKKVQTIDLSDEEEAVRPAVTKKAAKAKAKKVISDDSDDNVVPPVELTTKTAPTKASQAVSDSSDTEVIARGPAKSRAPLAAARKPVKYNTLTDSESDNGDDLLFDVGKMVKGIGLNGSSDDPAAASRPLFSTSASLSRPGSSGGFANRKSAGRGNVTILDDDDDNDETDYTRLAPTMPRTAKSTVLSDDEDNSFDLAPTVPAPKVGRSASVVPAAEPISKAKAPIKIAAPKKEPLTKKALAAKEKSKELVVEKKMALSPAAKAYAAKQSRAAAAPAPAKASKLKSKHYSSGSDDDNDMEIDEVGKMANDMLSDEDDDDVVIPAGRSASAAVSNGAGGRPARRAAAEASKKKLILDDEDGDEDSEEGEGGEDSEEDEEEEPSGDFDSDGSD